MANGALQLDKVTITLGGHVHALQGVTAEVPAGQITGFIGPSGAGKTTLIRAIVGRQRLTSGGITIFGQAAGTAELRHKVSYMTQEPSVYRDLTVAETLRYFAIMVGVARGELVKAVDEVVATVDLAPQRDQLVGKLSGGQRQRVSLAITLLGNPQLLVLDEPTVGLDPLLREQLWALFRRLAAGGTTIIISSHVMEEAERCDGLLLVRDGRLLAQGSPADLRRQTSTDSVEASFLKLVGGAA